MTAKDVLAKTKALLGLDVVKQAAGALELAQGKYEKTPSGLYIPKPDYSGGSQAAEKAMFPSKGNKFADAIDKKIQEDIEAKYYGKGIAEEMLEQQAKLKASGAMPKSDPNQMYPGKIMFADDFYAKPIQGKHFDYVVVDDPLPLQANMEEIKAKLAAMEAEMEAKTGMSPMKTATQELAELQGNFNVTQEEYEKVKAFAAKEKMAIVKGSFNNLMAPGLAKQFEMGSPSYRRHQERLETRVRVLEAMVAGMLLSRTDDEPYKVQTETLREVERMLSVSVIYYPSSDEYHVSLE